MGLRLTPSDLFSFFYRNLTRRSFTSTVAPTNPRGPNSLLGGPPWNILFFGSDQYSVLALQSLLRKLNFQPLPLSHPLIRTVGICSRFDEPLTDLAKFAKELSSPKLPLIPYEPSLSLHDWDLGVVASFGSLLPSSLISSFPYGILCIHPSLLPRWRGAAPLPRTILNGDLISGVSIFRIMPDRFDVGPILAQESIPMNSRVTSRGLGEELMDRGMALLFDCLQDLPGAVKKATPQSSKGVTYAKKINPRKTFVDWWWTVEEIDRFYRALCDDFDIRTVWGDVVVKVGEFSDPDFMRRLRVEELVEEKIGPGELFFHRKRDVLCVRCKDGWVGVGSVCIPGRRTMSGKDFYNGFLSPNKNQEGAFKSVENALLHKKRN